MGSSGLFIKRDALDPVATAPGSASWGINFQRVRTGSLVSEPGAVAMGSSGLFIKRDALDPVATAPGSDRIQSALKPAHSKFA